MSWKQAVGLVEIVNDTLFVGDSIDDLQTEVAQNAWSISMSDYEKLSLTADDLQEFLDAVLINRASQLRQVDVDHGLIFYVWFDAQALQLRFSLISDFHEKLPFGCQIVESELRPIIEAFLSSRDAIPYHDLTITDIDDITAEVIATEYALPVHQKHIAPA